MATEKIHITLSNAQLPKEMIYFYLVAPLIATPVLVDGLFDMDGIRILRTFAATYVPFIFIPMGIHTLYAFVMPHLVERVSSIWAKAFLHAVVTAIATVLICLVIRPLHNAIGDCNPPLVQGLITGVVITWTFILPALIVQDLRAKAEYHQQRLQEERRIALQAQLEAIRARTNPHFLFNAMNTIASLIQEEPNQAEATLERLADVLRYALRSAQLEHVTLEKELEMLEDYLEIQKARFGKRLRYEVNVAPHLKEVLLPPLLLQPLVENAVLHGISAKSEGGTIAISAMQEQGRVVILVEDDGQGPAKSAHKGHGFGLSDIKERLRLLYDDRGHMDARENANGGFTVELSLPLLEA